MCDTEITRQQQDWATENDKGIYNLFTVSLITNFGVSRYQYPDTLIKFSTFQLCFALR